MSLLSVQQTQLPAQPCAGGPGPPPDSDAGQQGIFENIVPSRLGLPDSASALSAQVQRLSISTSNNMTVISVHQTRFPHKD